MIAVTARSIMREIIGISSCLIETEIASAYNATNIYPHNGGEIVSWRQHFDPLSRYKSKGFATFDQYLQLLEDAEYTIVLYDGSIVQIAYYIKSGSIEWHRLGYYPCPISLDMEIIQSEGIGFAEYIKNMSPDMILDGLKMKTPLRFDYDPKRVDENHSAAHLHFNEYYTRVPVFGPLSVGQFIEFIITKFYPENRDAVAKCRLPLHKHPDNIDEKWKKSLHISCIG